MSHELASSLETDRSRPDRPVSLRGEMTPPDPPPETTDLPDALHSIALTILRAPDIRWALSDIARLTATELGLHSVSIGVAPDGWVARWGSDHDDHVVAGLDLPADHLPEHLPDHALQHGAGALDADALPAGCCACLPITVYGERFGVILATAGEGSRIGAGLIDAIEQVAQLVGASLERESRPVGSAAPSHEDVSGLLDVLERLATLPTVDPAIQPLLADISILFRARETTLILTDAANLECYSSRPDAGAEAGPDVDLLTAAFVRRALSTQRAQVGTLHRLPDGAPLCNAGLAVPLIIGGEAVGVLTIELDSCGPLSETSREMAATIGRHLAISVERERRMRSYSRHNYLLALVERVSASIARSTSADDLFPKMAREIRRSFGYDCTIAMIENDRLKFLAMELDDPETMPGWVAEGIPLGIGIMGRVARTGQPVFLRDVSEDPAFLDTGRGSGSEIAAPIRVGGEVVGVINIESVPAKPLEQLDYEIMLILANHIGIALNNRHLIASERESRQAVEAVQRISTIVAETLDPDESLRRIAETLGEVMGYPLVSLALLEGEELVRKAGFGHRPDDAQYAGTINRGISGRVARTGKPVFLTNTLDDPDYISIRPGLTSEICVPIRCNGDIVGIINVEGTHERQLTERDLHLLTTFAEHAGVLLNNARAYAALSKEATLDPMTGVPNLRYFQQQLQIELEKVRREEAPLSLAVIDMDYLKHINDSYGHLVGDQVLRELARRMQAQLRGVDLLARYAGDEFVAILPGVDEREASDVARRLVNAARSTPIILPDIPPIQLSISIGVATFPDDAASSTDLLRAADMAMYVAKESGKDRVSTAQHSARVRQGTER